MPSKPSATPASATTLPLGQPNGAGITAMLEPSNAPKPIDAQAMASQLSNAAPTLEPPAAVSAAGGITATWVADKKVTALWTNSANRNTWFGVAGVGWKKFADNSDSAAIAFSLLAANARITQGNSSYREEADGKVYELYVW
jgi:hypothetical protein